MNRTLREPDRQRILTLQTRRDLLGEHLARAKAEYEDAMRIHGEAFEELMQYEDSRCHKLIRSGRNPLYCQLERGHDDECWSR